MKTKLVVLIFLLAVAVVSAQTTNLTALLQQGLIEEQANHNLDAAISDYQTLATQFDKVRKLAATAIFRLGECYRMQGKTNEAVLEFRRILRDFSDQTTLAALSRQNLAGLGSTSTETPPPENAAADLWNRVNDLPQAQLEKVLPTLVPDAVLTSLLRQRSDAETKLAALRVDYGPKNPDVLKQKAVLKDVQNQISEKIDGMMQALKLRAELPASAVAANAPDSNEDREITRIRQMIQNSPDLINAPDSNGHTPLEKAAINGWLKVAAFLLDHGADVNARGGLALIDAAQAGNRAMVEFLLAHGANVNGNVKGTSPLFVAVQHGFEAVTKVLLANKANVNGRDSQGNTPLFVAAQRGQTNIVQMLLAAGAKVNVENNQGRTSLSFAAENGSLKMVEMLLVAKADPNGGKLDAPLLCAIHKSDVTVAKLLLEAGANPNAKGEVDWQVHNSSFHYEIINHYRIGRGWAAPLWLAIDMNEPPMVQLLLKFKADPNDSQTDGHSLLFDALSNTNILESLLDAGADPNKRLEHANQSLPIGRLPLEQAIFDRQPASVSLLLAHGARVNSAGVNGMTPLLWAANRGANTNIIELLVKAGADVNAIDDRGDTPLHYAVMSDYGQIVGLLLAHKANPNLRNHAGQSPLDIVKQKVTQRQNRPGQPEPLVSAASFGPHGMAVSQASVTPPQEIEEILLAHGALENLPDWNSIKVARPGSHFSATVFKKSTNDWNHFTLLETILGQYEHNAGSGYTILQNGWAPYPVNPSIPFPNLASLVVVRPSRESTNVTRIKIDLLNGTHGIDCSKDVPLEFGDVVEIPEREHTLAESDTNGPAWIAQISDCLRSQAGTVKLVVAGGQTVQVQLDRFGPLDCGIGAVLNSPQARRVLTSASDLSHVKVTRHDPKTGKTSDWILDCSHNGGPGLWLHNGDVINVPERR